MFLIAQAPHAAALYITARNLCLMSFCLKNYCVARMSFCISV